ncbi:uncharacterized protein LOC117314595 [Pecten maximus]|uniref:uncharacterized protein LOC117314595 n=1 Tax=Pecten maximus TaxID=6579 RepID=UPI0014580BD3|nr:uncharacterized protein LOC117314595 [Pecten maximus]
MECVNGVQGIKELIQEGTPVDVLEGDGDNTLMSRLRTDLHINVKKRYDKNHINQGNKEELKENLQALIPHQFGDHKLCKARFCGYKRNPSEKYQHRSLPYKSHLKDPQLRQDLGKLFETVISNAEQYADLGSSQQCEHANRQVTLRAPKSLHYGDSESLDYRVHATAAFINEGRNYISQANEKAGLSPGHHTVKYAERTLKQRRKSQARTQLPSTKRRRLILKQERAITQGAQDTLEGDSYESGIGLNTDPDIETLPDAVAPGNFSPIVLPSPDSATMVTFDLETTDLIRGRRMPHITQIAAVELSSGNTFNSYVSPKSPQTNAAKEITRIIAHGDGSMSVDGKVVKPDSIHTAASRFLHWMGKFHDVFLIAHNGRRFDFPVLLTTLKNIHKERELCDIVTGCLDSIHLFKKAYPGQDSYKQEDLFRSVLQGTYEAHNAIADVQALGKLVSSTNLSRSDLLSFSFSPHSVLCQLDYNTEKAKNYSSLASLVDRKILSKCMAEKIAGSGLTLYHLQAIMRRDGEDGLRNTFLLKNNEGQNRVKCTKKALDKTITNLVNARLEA